MYTWEIEKLLKIKNYILYCDEYVHMIDTSPQIKEVKYNAYDDTFDTWTREDDSTINHFKYRVKKREDYSRVKTE